MHFLGLEMHFSEKVRTFEHLETFFEHILVGMFNFKRVSQVNISGLS